MMISKRINEAIYSINAAALLLGAASLLSRMLGVLRDRMLASRFGASRELDIYYAAFQLPDFVYKLFLIGAASAAIIPIFLELKERDGEESKKLMDGLLRVFLGISLLASLLMIFMIPYFMPAVTPGFNGQERNLTVTLARIMMISPLLLGLSSIVSSVVQSLRRFIIFSLSPIFYNLGIIFGIVVFLPIFGLPGLALGVVLGALLHFLIQYVSFLSLGYEFSWWKLFSGWKEIFSRSLRKIVRLSFPRVVAMSIGNATMVALVAISSTLSPGSIAIFQFANNLSFLPIGIFGISFAVAAFPAMSEYYFKKDRTAFTTTLAESLRSVLFWILPLSVFFFVLRAQIVRVALGAGEFGWGDTRLTAASLGILSLAIVANSVSPTILRAFFALGNTRRPLFINIFTAALTVILSFLFIIILKSSSSFSIYLAEILKINDLENIGILGIMLGISIGALFDLVFLSLGIWREIKIKMGSNGEDIGILPEIIKMTGAAILAGLSSFGALRLANVFVSLDTFWGVLFQGSVSFLTGVFIYGIILYILGNKEIKNLLEVVRRRLLTFRSLPQEFDGQD